MLSIPLTLFVMSCGGAAAVSPERASVPAHEREAAQNEAEARQHDARYDPNATVVDQCAGLHSSAPESPCWTSVTNPTDAERHAAEEHRRLAAEHRAASAALRAAEARACVAVSEADRDLCPLMHAEDILSVEPLNDPATGAHPHLVGAVLEFRSVAGLDVAWLQRVLSCHAAQAEAYGEGFENPSCPVVPRGVTVQVTQAGNSFHVALRAPDDATADHVLADARALVAHAVH